jgi:endonuclease YncB( thermonuclease family)
MQGARHLAGGALSHRLLHSPVVFRSLAVLAGALAGLSFVPAQAADAWPGRVTYVSDGDTLWVRPAAGGRPRKVRLHGIDAPELCQAHGPEARSALQHEVLGREVNVQPLRDDDYGRLLARLRLGGQDVAAPLVRAGHAWSYRYRRSPGPYAEEEGEARAARRGLFADARAQRPYAFRRQHGPCT